MKLLNSSKHTLKRTMNNMKKNTCRTFRSKNPRNLLYIWIDPHNAFNYTVFWFYWMAHKPKHDI